MTEMPPPASPSRPLAVRPPAAVAWTEAPVRRLREGRFHDEVDRLAVEAPLEIRFGGRPFTVLMRTPGNDEELVAGFLFSEGLIRGREEIRSLAHPESLIDGDCRNVIAVELQPPAGESAGRTEPALEPRSFYASASCGVCGKSSIADLAIHAPPVRSRLTIASARLASLPARLREEQTAFAETGGLHGAGLFDADGQLLAAREDIGRHNAVDKLIGWALHEGRLPLSSQILVVSGRLGFEIVQKSIVAGIPLLAAVGAASSIAVALADRFGLTLATFLKPAGLNLYGDRSRIADGI
ncbi:MAG: formate dehydrogenase accessory sulfurtransferase FdhD [Thermoanaerobaculia bacterium]